MKIPNYNIKGTPYEGVRFQFVMVTPALAQEWLKQNKRNRAVKESTVDAYARDMSNGEWLTNHQGGAFFEDGDLMDFQHRLMAVVRSGKSVLMVVSTGWPKKIARQNSVTMDGVDRGVVRSLRDQLELQHGIEDAKDIVPISAAIAAIAGGMERVHKQTTNTILSVVQLYREEFKWMTVNVSKTHGLRSTQITSVVMLGMAVWPEKAREFYQQLKSGLNLTANSPVWHLRNWALSLAGGNSYDDKIKLRLAVAHHLKLYVEGKPIGMLCCTSPAALNHIVEQNGERAKKIQSLYGDIKKANSQTKSEPEPASNAGIKPNSPEAIEIGEKITGLFTVTDLSARLDGGIAQAGQFLADWRSRRWIESHSPGQFGKTEKFGK